MSMDLALEHLQRLVQRQQEDIAGLLRESAACRTEVTVLRECLFAEGLLRPSLLQGYACRHQAVARQTACFNEMMQVDDTALLVAQYAGTVALRAARGTSTLMRSMADRGWSVVRGFRQWVVYICGGSPSNDAHPPVRFVPALGSWDALPQMRANRADGAAAVVAGCLYVCGGISGGSVMSSVERFDPVGIAWEEMPPMLIPRQRFSAGSISGSLYVCGGLCDDTSALCAAERFDPTVRRWESLRPMSQHRAASVAGVLDGRLYVCGGVRNDLGGSGELRSVECFDPNHHIWQVMPPMFGQRACAAAAVLDRRLYVSGGISGMEILSSVECFDPEAGSWAAEPWMLVGRFSAMAAAASGRLYVFGGRSGLRYTNTMENSIEVFEPEKRAWVTLPPMQERRSHAMIAASLE
mmetsp:Transcript_29914/g.85725  ORF Transcript_29914/g.85725 Transcript_29914/m.85725 type:complete len:410 (+) Transcript_29914:126-1355(+)